MKTLGRKLKHDQHEYYLLEDGYNADTRAVVILCRPANPLFQQEKPPPPVSLSEPGEWRAVARMAEGELHVSASEHNEHTDLLGALLDEYEESAQRPPVVAWALTAEDGMYGTLEQALPMGVAIHCYDDREAAETAAKQLAPSGPFSLIPIDDRARFLNQMVREGYAGAMWNGALPVFFCLDAGGALQYLRVSPEANTVGLQILDERDLWDLYEGAEEIQFLDNSEACDERLVAKLGAQPVLSWPTDGTLLAIGPGVGVPGILKDDEEDPAYAVLFTDEAAAEEFREDCDPTWVTFAVPDLARLLNRDELSGTVAQLNPGRHRAHGGTLWSNGEDIVLDSFSGFWKLTASGFELAAG